MNCLATRLGLASLVCVVVACGGDDSLPADVGLDSATDVGSDAPPSDVSTDPVTDVDGGNDVAVDSGDVGEDVTVDADLDTGPDPPELDEIAAIFRTSCSPCHTDQVSGGLSLRDDDGLLGRLTQSSFQAAPLPRVSFGDLDGSYLWRKLEGTNVEAGGSGQTMPLSGSLSDVDRATIRAWIVDGGP